MKPGSLIRETGPGVGRTEIEDFCRRTFADRAVDGKRLLFVVPDATRTCPVGDLFRILHDQLGSRAAAMDFLVALGTHPAMSDDSILRHFGINRSDREGRFSRVGIFNHEWKNPDALRTVGVIHGGELAALSEGRIDRDVPVTVNRRLFDYDLVTVVGPVFPHEVVGFSGGNKYFFPGVAGADIIDTFHWLGALITNRVINGTRETPVRRVIDQAASFLPFEKLCLALVMEGKTVRGIFSGSPEEAFSAAAELSDRVNVVYKDRPYVRVLSCAPEMYDDLWTAGKCMYKLEPVVADGGELVIYAPHVTEVSVTHGATLRRIGYHVRDYFTAQPGRFADIPGGVMAHSTHVKGVGSYANGVETPRIRVTLATGIPESECREINLGYLDWRSVRLEDWKNRENEGVLVVPKAGEVLFKLRN
jgi:lactate racemase